MRALERYLLLQIIDQRWREHLYDMDYLREGIHLRGFAQIDPLVAYKNEAFDLFADLMNTIWADFARMIFHVEVEVEGEPATARRGCRRRPTAPPGSSTARRPRVRTRAAPPPARARSPRPRARRRRRRTARLRGRGAASPCRAAPRRRARPDRPQRPVLVRVGQEVQEVPRRIARAAPVSLGLQRPWRRRRAGCPGTCPRRWTDAFERLRERHRLLEHR